MSEKTKFLNTLCSNCSRNYGIPEFREHTLTEKYLTCRMCGRTHEIVPTEIDGLTVLKKVKDGRERRQDRV